MNRIFLFLVLAALFLAVDYYLFQAVKVAMRSLAPNTQRWITYIYWALPVIAMTITIVGFYMYPAYLSYKTRNLLAASVFLIYISKVIAVPILLLDDLGRLGRWIISLFQNSEP
ncbi:MAG: metallophosphoesterase, partial [Spirosomaceae bacterium]|nr:metallophosphoesterase [Spirosomataceae bacterium]